jgi:hypothetical protein
VAVEFYGAELTTQLLPQRRSFPPGGFYHHRLDNLALGTPELTLSGFSTHGVGPLRGLCLGRHPVVLPPTAAPNPVCNSWVFNSQAFLQHGCSLGPHPLLLLLHGLAPPPPGFISHAFPRGFKICSFDLAGLGHTWPPTGLPPRDLAT